MYEIKYISTLIKDEELLQKKRVKSGIRSILLLRKDLIMNRYTMKNIQQLK